MALRKVVLWSALGLALTAAIFPCCAQNQKESVDDVFWEVRQRQQAGAAAQVILARDPLTALILRDGGFRWKVWREPEFLGDTAPALNSEWLDELRDGTPMPKLWDKAGDEIRKDQMAIVKVVSQAVIFANETPADAFAKSAEDNSHVTFAHLWNDPARYRGKVIPITGRLVRLRKWPAPLEAQKKGIPFVYEGWIFGPTRGSHPFWVYFPNLPDALKEAEEMDRRVSFNGYFLKKIEYPAADGSRLLQTPLLIGPTVTLLQETAAPIATSPISMTVITFVVVVIVAVSIGLVLVNWYFHRGDQELKKRLARMQAERATTLVDEGPPEGIEEIAKVESKPRRLRADGETDF
jgi:hypothetical protein